MNVWSPKGCSEGNAQWWQHFVVALLFLLLASLHHRNRLPKLYSSLAELHNHLAAVFPLPPA
eukprot:1159385-Pelagomonas_calceolata.AAC.7